MSAALAESVRRAYGSFFEHAERTRRWKVADDLPWDLAESSPRDATLALCAESFCGVEMFLPDYVAGGLNLVRDDFGMTWFVACWGYEESKHALALREYLVRTGQRTRAEIDAYAQTIAAGRWTPPFGTARQMTLYGAIQEMTTFLSYKKQEAAAEAKGDALLAAIYKRIARDEMAHCGFYVEVARLLLDEDPTGTKADLAHVFRHFRMPATELIPRWDEHVAAMEASGLNRGAFVGEVWLPLLRRLGLTRRDLPRPPRVAIEGDVGG